MATLPLPTFDDAAAWVDEHLGHLVCDPAAAHTSHPSRPARRGGQRAADAALAALDITGYAKRRSQVAPVRARGASALSPYIRHNMITLTEARDAVAGAPYNDRKRFIDELWWQEYARHLYARVGTRNQHALRREPARPSSPWNHPLDPTMVCMREVRKELEETGWLVNQTRMWVASHWQVRAGHRWEDGEAWMFSHLLDGSRAANRYGWQWSVGSMTADPYGFSRWQVDKRAPKWCESCEHKRACPIQEWPAPAIGEQLDDSLLRSGLDSVGPSRPEVSGTPTAVWLTAESLGTRDPALTAWPDLPAVFVFDERLLQRLQLSKKRLTFLTETLAELADERPLTLMLGDPVTELDGMVLASTFAPVPGYAKRAAQLTIAATYPYPWLSQPDGGDVRSHSAWIRRQRVG
jgi:deoxyribodipyrimidine photo-lyase